MRLLFHPTVCVLASLYLSNLVAAKAQVGQPPLLCSANITLPVFRSSPKPVSNLPLELPQHAVLRAEFERLKIAVCAPAPMKPIVAGVTNISTNRQVGASLMSLVDRASSPRKLDPLFANAQPEPAADALLDFNPDRAVIYFPAMHASFKGNKLTFDFDRILCQTFGDENVCSLFKRSTMAVVRRDNDVLFALSLPIPFGR